MSVEDCPGQFGTKHLNFIRMKKHRVNNNSLKSIFIFGQALLLVNYASAINYYCSPNGSMANNGLSTSTPWANLEIAVSQNTFADGDVIYLMSGNHGFPVISEKNTAFVTIAKASGEYPVLQKIKFDGASYWMLDGLDVSSGGARVMKTPPLEHPVYPIIENSLIQIVNSSSYISLKNCFVYSIDNISFWTADDWNFKAWTAVYADGCSHITVESSHFKNINFGFQIANGCEYATLKNTLIENFGGDAIRAMGYHVRIENNIVKDSYDTNGNHDDAIQYHQTSTDVVIRGNKILNVTDYSRNFIGPIQGIYGLGVNATLTDFVIENNLICVDHSNAICVGRITKNCKIVNNTIVQRPDYNLQTNPRKPRIWVINNDSTGGGPGCVIRNNIIHSGDNAITIEGVNKDWTVDHNLEGLSFPNDYKSMFESFTTENMDFHLRPGAERAIDKGNSTYAPTTDLDGNSRVGNVDIGCYEFSRIPSKDYHQYGIKHGEQSGWSAISCMEIMAGFNELILFESDLSRNLYK
jgi:hypothetical protein